MLFKKTISAVLPLIMSAGMATDILGSSVLTVRAEETTTEKTTTSVTTTQSATTSKTVTTTAAQSSTTTKAESTSTTTDSITTETAVSTTVQTDFILGDVNNNGMVDAVDASAVLTYYAVSSTGKDGGFTETQLKAADMNLDGTVNGVDASAILTLYAKNSVGNNDPVTEEKTVELENFKADVWNIYINTEENVKFTVNVNSAEPLPQNAVSLYDGNDKLLSYMVDDGTNGDEKANDGVYSAEVLLSSAETENVAYYAATANSKSDTHEIGFYRTLTEDDVIGFTKIVYEITPLSFEEACEYIKSSEEIKKYQIDNDSQTIFYQTVYGFRSFWESPSDDKDSMPNCGRGAYAFTEKQMKISDNYIENGIFITTNYEQALEKIRKYNIQPTNHKNHNVAVLKQTKIAGYEDNFEYIGKSIAQALNKNSSLSEEEIETDQLYIMDGEYMDTYEALKHLENYDTVILDAHGYGGITDGIFYTYIMTGRSVTPRDIIAMSTYLINPQIADEFSADIFDGSIVASIPQIDFDKPIDFVNFYLILTEPLLRYDISVGARFFEKYYSDESLDDSIWILANCKSMTHDKISDAILSKGAETVVGFSDEVSVYYRDNTMFETLVNSMIFSADTVGNGIKEAERIYGNVDPYNTELNTKISIKGNKDYRLVDNISDNQIYDMRGPLYISFPPLDSGKNYEPRTIEILEKLHKGLNDSEHAAYTVYSGEVALSFGRLYHYASGSVTGTYESFDEILNCAKDKTFPFTLAESKAYDPQAPLSNVGYYYNYNEDPRRKGVGHEAEFYNYIRSKFEQSNIEFNLFAPLSNRPLDLKLWYTRKNYSNIIIVKDDYYLENYNNNQFADFRNEEYINNYFKNLENGNSKYDNYIYYVIDLREKYDYDLNYICCKSGGQYIKYSEEELDRIIKLINARRAYSEQ